MDLSATDDDLLVRESAVGPMDLEVERELLITETDTSNLEVVEKEMCAGKQELRPRAILSNLEYMCLRRDGARFFQQRVQSRVALLAPANLTVVLCVCADIPILYALRGSSGGM